MNLSELKKVLIQKIIVIDDLNLLMEINDLLDSYHYAESAKKLNTVNETVSSNEKVRIFTEEEKTKINIALQQVENGEYISDDEAQKEIQAWLED